MSDVLDRKGRKVGSVSDMGLVLNNKVKPIGAGSVNGMILDRANIIIGKIDPDGSLYEYLDQVYKKVGKIDRNGEIINEKGEMVGFVEPFEDLDDSFIISAGAAAFLLILRPAILLFGGKYRLMKWTR